MEALRRIPSVDALLQDADIAEQARLLDHSLVAAVVRETLDVVRAQVRRGQPYPGDDAVAHRVLAHLAQLVQPTLQPVINATGIVLHTNLGRAPLSDCVLAAMQAVGQGYSNLEFELDAGRRGSRYTHAEELLCRLTGAEAALLVNNNAGAVLLTLSALAREREVIISRGQLVEIGGGFRIPDVMAQSGAHLVEVGTTNRTHLRDYEAAITGETAALMRAHASNFRISGFAHQPELGEMVRIAHDHDLLVFDDLGSGTLLDTAAFGLTHEPTIQESVAAGADVITFSGDKLLGGPQGGIIVGRANLIERLRRFPLTRALRVDKTTIAGIQTNLLHYLKGQALTAIPVWQMIAASVNEIERRATDLLASLGNQAQGCDIIPGRSMVGGGSLPEESLPTALLALPTGQPTAMSRSLRMGKPAVVARIERERVMLDLRTVFPCQETQLAQRLREVL